MLLPFQAALNGPIKNARKFRGKFNTEVFVLLFSTKCTVERDRLDTAPDAVISVIDLREAVSRQEYLTNYAEL